MTRQRSLIALNLIFLCFICIVPEFARANEDYMVIDKEVYFPDENINITASFTINCIEDKETLTIQFQIYDMNETMLWSSQIYHDDRTYCENFSISIEHLTLNSSNSQYLQVKMYIDYDNLELPIMSWSGFQEEKIVQVVKREVDCEWIDFYDNIEYMAIPTMKIRFYENTTKETRSSVSNQKLASRITKLTIIKESEEIFTKAMVIEKEGLIETSLLEPLGIGNYQAILTFNGDDIFSDYTDSKSFIVGKAMPMINLSAVVSEEENRIDILAKVFYGVKIPISNRTIQIIIFNNNSIKFKKNYTLDENGTISDAIYLNSLILNQSDEYLMMSALLSESEILRETFTSVELEFDYGSLEKQWTQIILTIIGCLGASAMVFYAYLTYTRSRKRALEEIVLKV